MSTNDQKFEKPSFVTKVQEFFKKKKIDAKFKNAGEGQRLSDNTRRVVPDVTPGYVPAVRMEFSDGALRAGEAAISRRNDKEKRESAGKSSKAPDTSLTRQEVESGREEMQRALELRDRIFGGEIRVERPEQMHELLFCCPTLFDHDIIGGYKEMENHIAKYLISELHENPLLASCLIIISRCKNANLLSSCLKILDTLINNIIKFPNELKYRKIRLANEKIKENILQVEGAIDFLKAIGFSSEELPKPDSIDEMESYLIMHDEFCNPDKLQEYLENLKQAEPIKPILYRNSQVFHKTNLVNISEEDLPSDFFRVSLEEMKRQNYIRKQQLEESGMLLTKTMRENMKLRDKRKYRYVLIRVIFPNNWVLQGTFYANSTISEIHSWIVECLKVDNSFFLSVPPIIRKIIDFDQTIVDANLAPCSNIRLTFDNITLNECSDKDANYFLKDHLMK